jgi:hypothetical protein
MKNNVAKNILFGALVTTGMTLGLVHAASWDPANIIAEFNVPLGPENALDADLRYRDVNFLSVIQANADINGSLDGQFKILSVDAPQGIIVTEYGDNNGTGPVWSLQRARRDELLQIGLSIAVPYNTPKDTYPVSMTIQNVETGATRVVEFLVNVQ